MFKKGNLSGLVLALIQSMNLHKLNFLFLGSLFWLVILGSNSVFAATSSRNIIPWPNSTMPFVIEDNVPSDVKKIILKAVDRINNLNIVKLVKVSDDYDGSMSVFTFKKSDICSSGYGWQDGPNNLIKISKACTYGNILHEIMHALGFLHEQLNPTSDSTIHANRMILGPLDQYVFDKAHTITLYDYKSIMHYDSHDNSLCYSPDDIKWDDNHLIGKPHDSCRTKNWKNLTSENNNGVDCRLECAVITNPKLGLITSQRNDLSELDIEGLRIIYQSGQ